jgi:WD40 repeat protein/serine/threonine protein kinase/tetratricopeptide (TPR) repeat protein
MAIHHTCEQGHRWEAADGASPCPVCGRAATPAHATPPAVIETLAMPPEANMLDHGPVAREARDFVQKPVRNGPIIDPVVFDSDPGITLPPERGLAGETDRPHAPLPDPSTSHPTIPGYQILGELGRGGMGVVYKAQQLRLKRLVALKMILAGPHAGSEELERFVTEAEAAARLQHANIVQIYEIGEHEGRPYFSLEYVEGGSLADRLNGKPQPPWAAAQLVEALARAMHYAHEKGIVHRDLKPANILLAPRALAPGAKPQTGDCVPKITDFGLAKKLDEDSGQTRTGSILGTPNYMSPEQATGQVHAIGPASDIYALGAILYELLTGRPPFEGESAYDTLRRVATSEPVGPRALVGGMPRDVETVCLKCLHKDARRRYADAQELARDLRRFHDGEPIQARPTPTWERTVKWVRRRPGSAALFATGVIVLLGMAAAGLLWNAELRDRADREVRHSAELGNALSESQRRLVRLTIANGARQLDEGDPMGALPWFAEALRLERDDPVRERMHRLRLAAALEQCPQLAQVWFHSSRVNVIAFSADGRRILTASDDGTAQVHDTITSQATHRTLHPGKKVLDAAFSTNGEIVATASVDGTVELWSSDAAKSIGETMKHRDSVIMVAFSPDGHRLLTACKDGVARIWSVATQRLQSEAFRHGAPLTAALFNGDGSRILTSAEDGSVQVWDARTGVALARPGRQRGSILSLAISADGQRFMTGCADGVARVWQTDSGAPTTPPLRHTDAVLHVSFSQDGRLVATASADHTARVWVASTGKPYGNAVRHGSKVYRAVFGPSARRLLTSSDDDTARICDAATGEPLGPPLNHNGSVLCAALSPDGRWAATGGQDGMVRQWSVVGAHQLTLLLRHNSRVVQAAFSADGRMIATASADHTARLWDSTTGEALTPPLRHPAALTRLAFSPDQRLVLTACQDGIARLWRPQDGAPEGKPFTHGQPLRDAAFDEAGERVLTAGEDGTARIWNIQNGTSLVPPMRHDGPVLAAKFNPNGQRVVTASADGTARLWNANTGQPDGIPLEHVGGVNYANFSPDGHLILTAGSDSAARLWDASTCEPVGKSMRHGSPVLYAALSRDGRRVVTAGDDNTARVWSAETGEPLAPPLRHMGTVCYAAFSPDSEGRLTATASADGTVRVWDSATGEPITPPLKHRGPVTHVAFSPDGMHLVTSGLYAARVWHLGTETRPIDELVRAAQVLAVRKIDETGGLVALDMDAMRAACAGLRDRQHGLPQQTPNEEATWHRREAAECELCGEWNALAWHVDRLLATNPRDPHLLRQRGDARAGQGDWPHALDDYARAVEFAPKEWEPLLHRGIAHAQLRQWKLAAADFGKNRDIGTDDPQIWHYFALVSLAAEDTAAYRKTCAILIERFGQSADMDTAQLALWTAVLAPRALPNPARLLELAERLQRARPANAVYSFTLGATLVRAGKAARAIPVLEAALPNLRSDHTLQAMLFLTLACQQSGRVEEARQWFDRALETLNESSGNSLQPSAWDRELELEILRLEAERFFK